MGKRAAALGLASILLVACTRSAPIQAPTVVFVDRVRGGSLSLSADAPEYAGTAWKAKDEVEVEWRGSWWPAVVLEQRGNRWLVHYEGYGTDWDELVEPGRIRERREGAELDGAQETNDDSDP